MDSAMDHQTILGDKQPKDMYGLIPVVEGLSSAVQEVLGFSNAATQSEFAMCFFS